MFWEKEPTPKRSIHKSIGIDQGYKKLITCSDGKIYDNKGELFQIYQQLANKVHGSKASQRLQRTRTDLTNKLTKQFFADHSDCDLIIVEDLVDVKKRKDRKPFYKSKKQKETTRKVSKWTYRTVMAKLENLCAENGVHLYKVDPAFTSQTCSKCGAVDRDARDSEWYTCSYCGMEMDADLNAAINIHRLGVMYPGVLKARV